MIRNQKSRRGTQNTRTSALPATRWKPGDPVNLPAGSLAALAPMANPQRVFASAATRKLNASQGAALRKVIDPRQDIWKLTPENFESDDPWARTTKSILKLREQIQFKGIPGGTPLIELTIPPELFIPRYRLGKYANVRPES